MLRRAAVLLLDHVGVMAGHVHRRPSEAGLLLRFGYHRVTSAVAWKWRSECK